MDKNQITNFMELWKGVYESYGKTITETTLLIFFDVLKEYEFEQIRSGMKMHLGDPKAGSFVPRPSDIIRNLQSSNDDGHVCADVAWSMIPQNEHDSYVVTDQIMEAWGVALPLIESGDMQAARMAFRPAYEKILERVRKENKKVIWKATQGHNIEGREQAKQIANEKNKGMPNLQLIEEKKQAKRIELAPNPKNKIIPTGQTKTLTECIEWLNIEEPKKPVITSEEQKYKDAENIRRQEIIDQVNRAVGGNQ